jgi:hypothetical protein
MTRIAIDIVKDLASGDETLGKMQYQMLFRRKHYMVRSFKKISDKLYECCWWYRFLNTLNDKKAHPCVDNGVDKIEEKDKSNKHVDKLDEKESKKVTPHCDRDIFSYKNGVSDFEFISIWYGIQAFRNIPSQGISVFLALAEERCFFQATWLWPMSNVDSKGNEILKVLVLSPF